jgi:hypothetical protein
MRKSVVGHIAVHTCTVSEKEKRAKVFVNTHVGRIVRIVCLKWSNDR